MPHIVFLTAYDDTRCSVRSTFDYLLKPAEPEAENKTLQHLHGSAVRHQDVTALDERRLPEIHSSGHSRIYLRFGKVGDPNWAGYSWCAATAWSVSPD